jgi:membrane-associated protein
LILVDWFMQALNFLLTLDQTLMLWSAEHPSWVFGILFLIIFVETGVVVMPFLPGDSILFVGGAVCAAAGLPVLALIGLLIIAAVAGDSLNFSIGRYLGERAYPMMGKGWFRYVKPAYLDKTKAYFQRYGGYTIIIGRFVPFVRTFAPFMAGVGQMPTRTFLSFNIIGGVIWITSIVTIGYLFGNIPWVKANLKWVVVALIVGPALPVFYKVWRESRQANLPRCFASRQIDPQHAAESKHSALFDTLKAKVPR